MSRLNTCAPYGRKLELCFPPLSLIPMFFPSGLDLCRRDPDMHTFSRTIIALFLVAFSALLFLSTPSYSDTSSRWKITTIKICRTYRGYLSPHIEVVGSFPVYSFFIPRPVWTVNGRVVDSQPVYNRGRLTSFNLLFATRLLTSGKRNTIKFSLPDQNGSKIFHYDQTRAKSGSCYEFF